MEISLKDKKSLVTGGSHGIGREIAIELAKAGADVAIVYGHNQKPAEETVKAIQEQGRKAMSIQADLGDATQIAGIYDQVEAKWGRLDVLVSNAGIVINKPLKDYTLDDYEKTFNVNTRAPFLLMQQASQRLNKGGRIIAISSGGTKMLLSGTTLYLGSKGAVEQFVRGISQEVGDRGITVNTVSPGFTDTGLLTDYFRKTAAGMSPFNRLGQPADIAHVVTFLASDQAGWVTGQNIGVGGGVM